jgi:hypothetical protein
VSVTERPGEGGQPPAEYLAPPPVGEEIHIPGPSLIPFICAIGITLLVIGTTIDWLWSVVGGVILIVTAVIWIRDTRRDVSELPEQHQH